MKLNHYLNYHGIISTWLVQLNMFIAFCAIYVSVSLFFNGHQYALHSYLKKPVKHRYILLLNAVLKAF